MNKYKLKKTWDEMTKDEKLFCMLHFPEKAKGDKDWIIRLEAYRALGFTEEAKHDEYWVVRQEAYRVLGYTKEAKQDNDKDIRQEAELFFSLVEENELPITSMDELLDNIADDVMNLSIRIRNKKGVDNEEV